jgi:dipeptidyl aminopeptidase/acylaminoacyl peptidase
MPRVTRFPVDARRVRLSPDASRAAWTSDEGLHLVDRLRVPGAVVEDLAWSPDGAFVAASLADATQGPGGERTVRWLPVGDGEDPRPVPGASFAWEPRGAGLIVADPWTGEIRRHGAATGRPGLVCAVRDDGDPLRAPALTVSPDGARLAFTTLDVGRDRAEVRVVDLPSGEPRVLTALPKASIRAVPFWTPDARSLGLLVADLELGTSGLALVRGLEGEGELLYASGLILPPHRPAFSPSGRQVAFLDVERPHHEFTKAGPPRLALLDVAGRAKRFLTSPDEAAGDVRWLSEERLVVDGEASASVVEA